MITDNFVNLLKDFVEFHDIYPEADVRLGIPRNSVRLVRSKGETKLKMMQPATGLDCTVDMIPYCKDLYEFQTSYKYLFMLYSQKQLKELGNLLANHSNMSFQKVYSSYLKGVMKLLATSSSIPRRINVLMHILRYFSKNLSSDEKQYFLNVLEEY